MVDGGGTITGTGSSAITLNTGSYDLRSATVNVPLNGSAGLTETTSSNVDLNAANGYTGPTIIRSGTLSLSGSGAIVSSSGVSVGTGATFVVDNVSNGQTDDRVGTVDVTLSGGTFSFLGRNNNSASSRSDEVIGRVVVSSGASTLSVLGSNGNGSGASLSLSNATAGISRSPGSTLRFVSDTSAYVNVTKFTETNGIIGGWMLYDDADFASLQGSNTGTIVSASGYETHANSGSWSGTENVKLSALGPERESRR